MLYTSDQIIEDFRSDVADRADKDDSGNPRDTLWSESDVLRYLNSALARWASDTLALRRIFTIDMLANTPTVRFPWSEVIDIVSVGFKIPSYGIDHELTEFNLHQGWVTDDYGIAITRSFDVNLVGPPRGYTRDYDDANLRVWPVHPAAGVLTVNAFVMPAPIYVNMPLPNAMGRKDIDLVLQWMKYMAYRKQDADVLDLSRSDGFKSDYDRDIADRKSEIDRSRRDNGIMKPRR